MVTVVVQHADSDLQQLYCYVLGLTEWDCVRDLVAVRGAGVVVFDLDETIVQQNPVVTVRNGWGRFCQTVFRGGKRDKNGPHKYFWIYLCTRTTGDPHVLWEKHLAPRANGHGATPLPPVDPPRHILQYPRPPSGQWKHKSLKDVLRVYPVERHCAVIFDDRGLETEHLEGPDPLDRVRDNWDRSDRNSIFLVPPFRGYATAAEQSGDMALPHNGDWLRLARTGFVEALKKTGRALLDRREVEELCNLASYFSTQVSSPTP